MNFSQIQKHYNGCNIINIMLWNLNFFHKNSKKQEKEAGTNFVLFSRSKDMIGKFIKNLFTLANQDYAISYTQENSKIFNIT